MINGPCSSTIAYVLTHSSQVTILISAVVTFIFFPPPFTIMFTKAIAIIINNTFSKNYAIESSVIRQFHTILTYL